MNGVPNKYKALSFSNLVLRNEEQEELKGKLMKLYNWELSRKVKELYWKFNPSDMEPYFMAGDMNPTAYKEWLQAREELQQSRDSAPWCVTILGTVGNGKTTLTCAMINDFNRSEKGKAVYVTQGELVDDYKQSFSYETFKEYATANLLVIDEINVKDMTDFNRNLIQKILNERYSNQLRTVIIGNIAPTNFKNVFEEHIISRLREGITMYMKAPDMREKGIF